MSVCPVCGCKTDELDFVDAKLGGSDVRVCSFCEKQLKALGGDAPTAAQLHWMDAVLAKDVPERPQEIANALRTERARFPSLEPPAPPVPVPTAPAAPAGFTAPAPSRPLTYAAPAAAPSAPANAELQKRVEALENELKALKRKMLIQKIIELGLPVVLLLIIIIVFFASGLFDRLQQFFQLINMDFFG